MKKIKLFFALFAMLALGVGNAWGAEATVYTSNVELNTTGGSKATASKAKISNVDYSAMKLGSSGNAGYFYINLPANTTSLTLHAAAWNNKNSNKLTLSSETAGVTISPNTAQTLTANSGVSGNSTTYTITPNNTKEFFTFTLTGATSGAKIKLACTERCLIWGVNAETSGSGSEEPALSATPTEIDFGTVYQGTTVEAKTVAVNFANLIGDVTYSVLNTPFTATGAISATGDQITISADASTIGEYSQTLTVASTADSKTAEVTVKMNVVAAPAPTGTFTLHTGELIEGDYVIVDGTNAMNNIVTSNRLQYNSVTITNNEIVDPLATTIWHIAPNGEYWTVYSADADKYAASTDAKNQATLAASVSDNTKWTITKSDNTFDFENLARSEGSDSGNKYLRKNSTYGFACYASGTGTKLSLYRKAGTKYNVNISATTNGTVTADPTSAEAGTTITLTVTPAGGYVLDALTVTDASSNPITVTENKFTMPASDVTVTATFKENEKPAATLTLSKNGVKETFPGSWKQDDVVTLPSITSDCVKEFVGWSANPTCDVAPEYKAGDSYTLASTTQTLYAVYADVDGTTTTATVNIHEYATANSWGSSSGDGEEQRTIEINSDITVAISATDANTCKYYSDGIRIYQTGNPTITISTTSGELKSVKFTFTNDKTGTLLDNGVAMTSGTAVEATGTSATYTVGNSTDATNGQIRISAIEVTYGSAPTYSNYSTTCSAALETPTFSLVEGTYNEAQNVTISAKDGATIYYTTDGTEPTNESTEYSSAIVLDQCGETTIKAIAISADNQSPVAEATYTIQLPIPTNSAVDPYTEAEAIDVYNSGCYDGEELVYVTGTVQTAQFYNSGTYTITLTGGMQFYYFYEGADEDVFESDYINEGDDIVACGKLSMYNTIYQLAKGCYLVKHKPVAQLSWSKSTCTAEIGGTNEFPTLTNTNSVAVSYSSSNTAAATINETTGVIALVAAGETTITATFAGNENYKANSASYTLTVAEAVVRGTITYNTNGGTEVAAQENQTNLPETLPTTTKAGYNFGGWYTDAECNTPAVANSVLTGDITLHAKWLEPYTVAQALAMNVTTGVYVKGIISTITEVNTDYKNATYKISDDGTTTSEMIVYRGKNVDNTDFTSEDQIAVGDIVVIYGNLSEYNSAIQLAQGNYIYSLTEPTLYTVTISFETNGGEPVESIEANTLPDPFPTTTKEGHAFDGWYMDNALTIPAVAGTPITTDADITLYAKWTEVSKWATTYTSNIEVGSDEVIINGTEYEAQKTGTSSAYGSTSVVVPVSTHTLHFHAAGWGADNPVNLVVKNGETVLGTFELSKDAGVKNNSPYTLAGTPYQQYYSVSLTNITAETAITFEASNSGGERFVLYGVNQEGGIAPELNRIEITGEATTLTYEIGDVFDPAGLGVNAIYTLAGVDHETVAIDAEDVEWSFNPATIAAETSQVEVTATYMEKTATKTVASLTVNVPTPEITATPASIDWGTVNKDSEASKEVSVTLKAVANATISISGTNPSTFSVDKTALTETGTIVVSANTSSVGTFTATLTISDDAAAAEEKKISLKIIVEGIDDVYGNWQLVTDASTLKAGDMVIVASVEVEGKYYTMGKQNSNNRAAIESTVSETQLTPTTGTSVLTLVDAGDGKFAFQASNGKYLSAAGTGTSNYLREAENYDSDKTKWTISVTAEGIATIKATSDNRNWMRYNPNNGSPLFSCYGSGQTDIALYKRVPDYTRTGLSQGAYGTICLSNNIEALFGATLYTVAGKETNGRVVFDEVPISETEAGKPYIFLAESSHIEVYYGTETATEAGKHNSLQGTFEDITDGEAGAVGNILEGNYMVVNNVIKMCGARCKLPKNRAYFVAEKLDNLGAAPQPMPGRRRVTMGVTGENEATGFENITNGENTTIKVIENGQLIIIRNGEKYNVQGVRL